MSTPPTASGAVRIWLAHSIIEDTRVMPRFDMAYTGTPPTTAQLTTFGDTVAVAYDAHLLSLLPTTSSLTAVNCADLQTPSTPNGSWPSIQVGTRSGTETPNNFATLINFAVDRKYRGSKPKMFLPFGVEADRADSRSWGPDYVSEVDTKWAAFIAALTGAALGSATVGSQVCVSYYGPPTIPAPTGRRKTMSTPRNPATVHDITGVNTALIAGSQRRRLRSKAA